MTRFSYPGTFISCFTETQYFQTLNPLSLWCLQSASHLPVSRLMTMKKTAPALKEPTTRSCVCSFTCKGGRDSPRLPEDLRTEGTRQSSVQRHHMDSLRKGLEQNPNRTTPMTEMKDIIEIMSWCHSKLHLEGTWIFSLLPFLPTEAISHWLENPDIIYG